MAKKINNTDVEDAFEKTNQATLSTKRSPKNGPENGPDMVHEIVRKMFSRF